MLTALIVRFLGGDSAAIIASFAEPWSSGTGRTRLTVNHEELHESRPVKGVIVPEIIMLGILGPGRVFFKRSLKALLIVPRKRLASLRYALKSARRLLALLELCCEETRPHLGLQFHIFRTRVLYRRK